MGKSVNRNWLLLIIGFVFLLNVSFVLGAGAMNALESAFAGIGNIDLGALYMKYPQLCDGIFYIVFFIALFKAIMGRIELFKGNNTIPIVTAIAFAMSMMVLSNMMRPKLLLLKAISPIALLIAAGAAGVFIYQMIKDMTKANVFAAAISIAVVVLLLNFLTSPSIVSTFFGGRTGGSRVLTSTKQYATLSLFILLPVGVGQVWRNLGLNKTIHGSPSSSERTDERTFFPKQTETIEKLEGVERGFEKGVKDDKGETDLLQEEEGLERFDEYENILDAEAAKLSTQLQELKDNEWNGEQKEAGMLTALSGYGQNIDAALAKMNSIEVLDQAGKQYIVQNVQGIADVCSQIVENQKQVHSKRKETMGSLLTEDIKKIDDVMKKFKLIDQALMNIDKSISKDIGNSLVSNVEKEIKKQQQKLKEERSKLNSKAFSAEQKAALAQGLAELEKEIQEKENELKIVNEMKGNINQLAVALQKDLAAVKSVVSDMDVARKTLDKQSQNNVAALERFDKAILQMDGASQSLKHEMVKIGNEAQLAEEVPVKAAEGVATIFNTMISVKPENLGLQPLIKEYYLKDIIPSIDDVKILISKSNVLDKLISPVQTGITNLDAAYNKLESAAAKITGTTNKDEQTKKNITAAMGYVTKMVANEQSIRQQISNNVMNTLDKISNSVKSEIPNIDSEITKLQDAEKKTLGELSKALAIIVKNKSRVSAEFKKDAKQVNMKMAEATQNITQGRMAA